MSGDAGSGECLWAPPYSDPLRRPDGPWSFLTTFARTRPPQPSRASPTDRRLPSWHAVLTTPVALSVPMVIGWRAPAPGSSGSARPSPLKRRVGTTLRLSRPAQASLALRPAKFARPPFNGLCREVPTRPVSQPDRSPAIESNHQLFEWVLPPLVICPFRAHTSVPLVRCVLSGRPVSSPPPPAEYSGSRGRSSPDRNEP